MVRRTRRKTNKSTDESVFIPSSSLEMAIARNVSMDSLCAEDDNSADIFASLSEELRTQGLVWLRSQIKNDKDEPSVKAITPAQIRKIYMALHAHRFPKVEIAFPRQIDVDATKTMNLRGRAFPGYPESHVLGSADFVEDFHGLSGPLVPTGFWERVNGQYHHDGSFSSGGQQPPLLIAMTCAEAPGNGTGSTLFFDTRSVMRTVDARVAARARKMICVYTKGFDLVVDGRYPVMSKSMLVPQFPSPRHHESTGDDGAPACAQTTATSSTPSSHEQQDEFQMLDQGVWEDPHNEDRKDKVPFTYRLIQADETGNDEYVVVHSVCLDHLEEEDHDRGVRRALSWQQSMDFLEMLLGPAATQNVIEVDWKPGDMVVFDNLRLMHSVTPTNAYDDTQGQRRLMTRTAMQPTTKILVT